MWPVLVQDDIANLVLKSNLAIVRHILFLKNQSISNILLNFFYWVCFSRLMKKRQWKAVKATLNLI